MSETRRRLMILLPAVALAAAACSQASIPLEGVPPLPPLTVADAGDLLAAADGPVIVNVWASWCTPCRSEAPLLRAAHRDAGDRIRFIGLDVEDDQEGARRFIAEFGLDGFEHYFDPAGSIQANLGGYGVPQTFFFAPGGELLRSHFGVIDERTLALQIDELLRLGG